MIFQFVTTGGDPWMKYALEALLVLIIAPLRVKKKIKLKNGKIKLETVENKDVKTEEQPIKTEASNGQQADA